MSEASAAPAASASPAQAAPSTSSIAPSQAAGAKPGSPQQSAAAKGAPAQATGTQSQAETVAALRELSEDNMDAVVKMKVNGQVKQMSVREALKLAEKGEGADQKFQHAARVERQAQELSKLAKENPDEFMRKWGIDPDQYSQTRLAKLLEDQMMSPEQKRLKELEDENKRYKETEADRVARQKEEKEQTEFKAADQQYRNEVMEAWHGSGLPAHPSFGIEIAKEMLRAQSQNSPLTAQQAAARVKKDWIGNTGSILDQMDAEAIYQSLPKSVHDKLRGHYVQLVSGSKPGQAAGKNPSSASRPGQSPASSTNKNSGKKMLTEAEYREHFKNL